MTLSYTTALIWQMKQAVPASGGTGGSASKSQDPAQFQATAAQNCIYYAVLGGIVFVSGFIQVCCCVTLHARLSRRTHSVAQVLCWALACKRQVNAIRREFFYSVLRQNIAWFDANPSGSLTVKLSESDYICINLHIRANCELRACVQQPRAH